MLILFESKLNNYRKLIINIFDYDLVKIIHFMFKLQLIYHFNKLVVLPICFITKIKHLV
jgi:hypothetical protein